MIYFSGAKINLGLNILDKRQDGFHNIESVFYPVPLHDVIEIIEADEFLFTYTGIDYIEGENLIEKAYKLLTNKLHVPTCHIHLHKNIPIGAGLAGGSGNGTIALLALNNFFNLGLTDDELFKMALALGSDCPFFIDNLPALVSGRGGYLKPININLKGYKVLVVNPGIHISTKEAYSNLVLSKQERDSIESIVDNFSVNKWQDKLINDFEKYAFGQYPEIKRIKEHMLREGALYTSMTGTGSTIYGIFKRELHPNLRVFDSRYYIKELVL